MFLTKEILLIILEKLFTLFSHCSRYDTRLANDSTKLDLYKIWNTF